MNFNPNPYNKMQKKTYYKNLASYNQFHLRECQIKQVGILLEIDKICKKHDIMYWLDGGTLLGAVRHKGFIPWDDDIDIAMDKKSLKRFLEVAQDELPAQLFLQTTQTDPYIKTRLVKVRDTNSFFVEHDDHFTKNYVKGIFVDIFPFISHPDIPASWMKWIGRGLSKSYSILHNQHYYSLRSFAEFFWFGAKKIFLSLLWDTLCLIRKSSHYGNNKYENGYGITHKKDSVFPLGEIVFEDVIFPAPHNPDEYLKEIYGDYMQIPPEEKRVCHSTFILPKLV